MRLHAVTLIVTFFWQTIASAAEPARPLEMVPEHAAAALVFRSIDELKPKADAFLAEFEPQKNLATQLFQFAGGVLGVGKAIDDSQPLAVMAFDRRLLPEAEQKDKWRHPIAAGFSVMDVRQAAELLKAAPEELERGDVIERPGQLGFERRYYRFDGRHLWIMSHKELAEHLQADRSVRRWIPEDRRDAIESNDVILSFYADSEEFQRDMMVKQFDRWVKEHPDADEEERAALKKLFWFFRAVKYVVFSGSVDKGLTLDIDICYNPAVRKKLGQIIAELNPSGSSSSLVGLPDGNLLFGHAANSSGRATLPAMTILSRELHRTWWPFWREVDNEQFLTRVQFVQLFGLFNHVWNQLDGYRFGVYGTTDPAKHGLIGLAGILETEDASGFIEEMRTLSGLLTASASSNDQSADSGVPDEAYILSLVDQLGADNFRDRHGAWTKLLIIGEPALAVVEKATQSTNVRIARRAKDLKERMLARIRKKREGALRNSALSKAKPAFLFRPNAGKAGGHDIHEIELKLDSASEFIPHLRTLFGPNWNRLRLIPVGRQVIVTLGSEPVKETITVEQPRPNPRLPLTPAAGASDRTAHFRVANQKPDRSSHRCRGG